MNEDDIIYFKTEDFSFTSIPIEKGDLSVHICTFIVGFWLAMLDDHD